MKRGTGLEIGCLYRVSGSLVSGRLSLKVNGPSSTSIVHVLTDDIVMFLGKGKANHAFGDFEYRFLTKLGVLTRTAGFGECDEWFEKI